MKKYIEKLIADHSIDYRSDHSDFMATPKGEDVEIAHVDLKELLYRLEPDIRQNVFDLFVLELEKILRK